jgi:hypothetical protein
MRIAVAGPRGCPSTVVCSRGSGCQLTTAKRPPGRRTAKALCDSAVLSGKPWKVLAMSTQSIEPFSIGRFAKKVALPA